MAFNITDILNNKSRSAMQSEGWTDIVLHYKDIIITKHNKYSIEEINELATGIHMAGGLQQPLLLAHINDEYWLASGYRRITAIDVLVQEGEEEFARVPCRYKDMTELEFKMQLLIGNTFSRKMTDYDKMIEVQEWKELLQQMKKEGAFKPEKGTRTRDYIAAIMGEATGTIGTLQQISNNATDAVKEQFASGTLSMTAAAETSKLTEEEQNNIAFAAAAGQDTRVSEIKAIAAEKENNAAAGDEKEKRSIAEQKTAQMSDTDTTEEEKENARRLHVLKMLEKYYIYMNEDDVRRLEAMLEDCKRRKREYGLDDVGSTL